MLEHFVSITVPSTQGDETLPPHEFEIRIRSVARFMALKFGGVTVTRGSGWYVAHDNGMVTEDVAVVTAYHNGINCNILPYARLRASLWGQECVAITTDKGMEFVYPSVATGANDAEVDNG